MDDKDEAITETDLHQKFPFKMVCIFTLFVSRTTFKIERVFAFYIISDR